MQEKLISDLNAETDQSIGELNELINTTREIMLSNPGEPLVPAEKKSPLASGWKIAKEFQDIDDYFGGTAEEAVEGLEPDLHIVKAIEALGEQILEEAFECLGDEAHEFAKAFNEDTDELSRSRIIDWLELRVGMIRAWARHQFEQEDSETFHYSATRLSPKLIGTFPDVKMRPTCLGGSILAMSFFNKTDLPMLHGNISSTTEQEHARAQIAAINTILRANYEGIIKLDDYKNQLLLSVKNDNHRTFQDRGLHAAGYIRVDDTSWLQLDPSMGNAWIVNDQAENLDEIYNALIDKKEKGYTEAQFEQDISERIFETIPKLVLEMLPTREQIVEIFDDTPPEELRGEIIRKILKPYLPFIEDGLDSGQPNKDMLRAIIKNIVLQRGYGNIEERASTRYMQWVMDSIVEDYIFHSRGSELYDACKRCGSDEEYKKRRIADTQLAPLFMALKLHSDWGRATSVRMGKGQYGHLKAEVGLAPYRIGISVLSDTAAYLDTELPLSTWLTYWPSTASFKEHEFQGKTSPSQVKLARLACEGLLGGMPLDDDLYALIQESKMAE